MNSLLLVSLLLQVAISSSTYNYQRNEGFPDELDVSEDSQVEYCFRTISRTVDRLDDDSDDDDDDDDAPVGKQITRQCCEGWYTPEGKPLCSARKRAYVAKEKETKCDRCDRMDSRLAELEKIVKSAQATGGPKLSIGYLFIRYLKEKIGSLEEANKKQEEKIMYLEEQMVNLTSSFQTVEVVEATPATIERAALSTVDPCEAATCPDHPEAMCMVTSRCGKDIPVFVDEEFRTVNCNSNEPCDLLPPSFCPDDPCLGLQCDAYPEAICVVTECDCKPSFMLPDGSTPSCGNEHTFTPIPSASISVTS